ncbi:NRAMP family divalent metal transporter [Lentilactobacillus farraginis]|uniref:Transporter, branched chain amino acid cation symporter family protein n=2 Tax=Lentilactobacillus farraginis DSM 18382 = JCM 14108 TaxID=1423743 RepID=A0A0R1WE37_9LACO|nr:NRAMP family divalent metal transporter [Lentilactobacillus farraginis]KRM13094.1 transporter, branched chain amino acid cation symporter family protein [Lentilactobacillus farraginis DSM 18382 = JCM 14108]
MADKKTPGVNPNSNIRSVAIGAAFLMAMAAVGPGFLTQTATFTGQLGANFGFAILICILVDIIVQLNIWRIIIVAGKRAQVIANDVFPGLGYLLSFLVAVGGFFFNIGNIGGAGLGLNVLFGISPENGAIIAAVIAISIFIVRNAMRVMDRTVQLLAVIKIGILLYILWVTKVPFQAAATHAFVPTKVDFYSIVTIVGGTVGGYISFAGGHRLLEGGAQGVKDIKYVNEGALTGIGIASVIRIMLFLAGLAVVMAGFKLDPANPAASIFQHAAGNFGYKFFGLLLFASGMSSTLGSTFTSTSFLDYAVSDQAGAVFKRYRGSFIIGFIAISTAIFYFVGNPAQVLVLVGALNGFVLPISMAILLVASHRQSIMGGQYRHPRWLSWTGWIVVVFMAYAGVRTVMGLF